MRAAASLFLLSLAACAPTAENFPMKFAAAQCDRTEECDKGVFEDQYDGDMDECEQSWITTYDAFTTCDFDVEKAKTCLESLHNDTCGDLEDGPEGCAEVYNCDLGDTLQRR